MKHAHRVVPRLMLLMLVVLGVMAMHTIGHAGEHDSPMVGNHASLSDVISHSGQHPGDPTTSAWVCLAILGVAAGWLLLRPRSGSAGQAPSHAGSRGGLWFSRSLRGPPPPELTRLVVLRI
ncbi:hypothetical protein [Nonomuraea sp. NPDC048901]|uniref:hypothetical protein n=1 Tax=unclassified Nonomuraea TaxID=2593643 RepID=UPI0033DB26F5